MDCVFSQVTVMKNISDLIRSIFCQPSSELCKVFQSILNIQEQCTSSLPMRNSARALSKCVTNPARRIIMLKVQMFWLDRNDLLQHKTYHPDLTTPPKPRKTSMWSKVRISMPPLSPQQHIAFRRCNHVRPFNEEYHTLK